MQSNSNSNFGKVEFFGGSIIGELNEKGLWIYKSAENFKLKNGNLKPVYHDMPRYKAVIEMEKETKDDYTKLLIKGVREAVDFLSDAHSR